MTKTPQQIKNEVEKEKWYFDWLNWADYIMMILIIFCLIGSFPLTKWEWGYYSYKLIATIGVMIIWVMFRNKVIEERRFEWIKKELGDLK